MESDMKSAEICKYNPIRLVRQSAKRKKFLAVAECQRGSAADCWSRVRERTLVLLDAGTGLRMSELFALKWRDINFQSNEISITRSIAFPVVGRVDRGDSETDSARCLPSGSAEDMAG